MSVLPGWFHAHANAHAHVPCHPSTAQHPALPAVCECRLQVFEELMVGPSPAFGRSRILCTMQTAGLQWDIPSE
jgi:hypothetical protein